ncbi:MAG: hypothetical protein EOO17_00680 [Chloroflexi bacterium]|nr:MAG: hypothetical protein EOO17_00680 [Chloroflexota bacterium]
MADTSSKKAKKSAGNKSAAKNFVDGERMGARRGIIEEMFNDMYDDRRNIYLMNFIRGIFFGVGSAIGGTIVVAIVVWSLSVFVNLPGVAGEFFQQAQDSFQTTEQRR